ncbi:MAG: Hsp33 family molecular chaperone [Methyloligellaceae bacterium]
MSDNDKGSMHLSSDQLDDNIVLPFYAEIAGVNGRVVRLGSTIDAILKQHDYPEAVSKILGEAIVLTFMMGTTLKFEGRLILQAQTKGAVELLVVQFSTPGKVRGYAKFNQDKIAAISGEGKSAYQDLMHDGHLAITIDQGEDMERYQGIVALGGDSLSDAAQQYFDQSEQLPSFVRLAVARHFTAGEGDQSGTWMWRAGGLMVQDLTSEGGREVAAERDIEVVDQELVDGDGWNRARTLAATVEDHELLDPMLGPEELVYRLFHEERVRGFDKKPLINECSCSRDHIQGVIKQFGDEEIEGMIEDGKITVTCEFCSSKYLFEREEF